MYQDDHDEDSKRAGSTGFASVLYWIKNRILLRESVFILLCRTVSKGLMFGFVLIAARKLQQDDFGDFQVIDTIINLVAQLWLALSLVIARVGSSYPAPVQIANLNWLRRTSFPWILGGVVFLIGASFVFDSSLATLINVASHFSFTLAGVILTVSLWFHFNIGFLQALEDFKKLGLAYIYMGTAAVAFGLFFIFSEVTVNRALGALAISIALATGWTNRQVSRRLSAASAQPPIQDGSSLKGFSYLMIISTTLFLIILNMDLLTVKILFDRSAAGSYARMDFVGKMVFLLAASLTMVLLPRVSKALARGSDTKRYLAKATLFFFITSFLGLAAILLSAELLSGLIYGQNQRWDLTVLGLIVAAKVLQSYMFILLNYGAAVLERRILAWIGSVLILQLCMFAVFHGSARELAWSITIPALFGVITACWATNFMKNAH